MGLGSDLIKTPRELGSQASCLSPDAMTKYLDEEAYTTSTYFSQCWKLDAQDQGGSRLMSGEGPPLGSWTAVLYRVLTWQRQLWLFSSLDKGPIPSQGFHPQ